MKLSECFAHYGATGKNKRWSWSARSPDGKTVVLTLWKDRLVIRDGEVSYADVGVDTRSWQGRPGNRERLENLIWARDNCGGFFRTVITVAKDTNERPRRIHECYLQTNYRMQIQELNEETGEFRAVHVPK